MLDAEKKLWATSSKLESYAYLSDSKMEMLEERIGDFTIMLDSGAYTASLSGKNIDIDDYIAFIQRWKHHIKRDKKGYPIVVALDVIGNAKKSMRNWKYMRDKGIDCIPVFHTGSDTDKVMRLYTENYHYIGLSRTHAGSGEKTKPIPVFDSVWRKYLCDDNGDATHYVHGFACTDPKIMRRYPWESVDSSTWQMAGIHGSINTPFGVLSFSDKSPNKKYPNKHYDTLDPLKQAVVDQMLHTMGTSAERLRVSTEARIMVSLLHYRQLEKVIQALEHKRVPMKEGLFI